jgi:hypothetical protein
MTNQKRDASDAAMVQIDMLMKHLADNSGSGGGESSSYIAAKESKVV